MTQFCLKNRMHGELKGRADIIQPPQTLHALRIRNDLRRTVSPSILEDIDMTIVTEDAILDPPETHVLMHDGLILLSTVLFAVALTSVRLLRPPRNSTGNVREER